MISVSIAGSPSSVEVPIRDKENGEHLFLQQANDSVDLGVVYTPALGPRCSPAAAKATGPHHFSGRLSPNQWPLACWHLSSPREPSQATVAL